MIYIGLATIGLTMSMFAAEVIPQIRRYLRDNPWDRKSEPRKTTLIKLNGKELK